MSSSPFTLARMLVVLIVAAFGLRHPELVHGQVLDGRLPPVSGGPVETAEVPMRRLPEVVTARPAYEPATGLADDPLRPDNGWAVGPPPSAGPPADPFPRVAQVPEPAVAGESARDGRSVESAPSAPTGRPENDGPIGPRPPEEINRLALRGTSLLLKPGTFQYDFTMLYIREEQLAVGLVQGTPVLERARSRTLVAPMSLRYGWQEDMEVFAVVPFGVSFFEFDNPVSNVTDQTGVLGDISLGIAHQLPKWQEWPTATLSFNVTAPTGANDQATLGTTQATLGNGVWRLGLILNLVESVDPFVIFGGVGYDYPFAKEVEGLTFEYGDSVNLYFGAGMAVTDDMSLSAQLNASFQDVTHIEGLRLPNSDREPVSLRLSLVRRLTLKSRVQPFLAWGVTDDAPDYSFGIRFVHDR